MPLFAALTLSVLSLSPQGGGAPQGTPVLTAAEQKSLHDKLAEYIKLWTEYDDAQDKARDKAAKAYGKAKEAFQKEWEAKGKKGDLLKSVPDLQAILTNCFLYDNKSPASLRKYETKGIPAHWLSVPKSYKADKPTRTVLLLPGLDDAGAWTDGQRYFEATWDKSASLADVLFHLPVLMKDIDLVTMPDYSKTGTDEQEKQRNLELLLSFGETQRNYNIDRGRVILDVGKGACPYALRAVTHFPMTFAGLVLRAPDNDSVAKLRLGSLNGIPILLVADGTTAGAATALQTRINALYKDSCTILTATDAYPYKAATPEIEKWMATCKRDLNKKRVVLEPNDDRYKAAYWANIVTMDTILTAPAGKEPRLEVEADRASNRITVKAVGIESFTLLLNDALVDLDKEVTVVINDKAQTQKVTRDLGRTIGYVRKRFDGEFVFPGELPPLKVPKAEEKPAETGGAGK